MLTNGCRFVTGGERTLKTGRKFKGYRFALWLATLGWTMLVGYLLLWPGEGTPVKTISQFFGGTDITDAIGHFFMFLIEATLIARLAASYLSSKDARKLALVMALSYGLLLETAQLWLPARGFAILDVLANLSGAAVYPLVTALIEKRK